MTEQSGLFIKELEKRMPNQNKLRKLENKRIELVRKIQLCNHYKEQITMFVQELNNQHNKDLISYKEYYHKLNRALDQKTPEQWIQEYDSSIWYYKHSLDSCEREIKKQENKAKIAPVVMIAIIFMILGFGLVLLKPTITGLITGIGEETYTQEINLVVNESYSYEWQLENIGILSSAGISGKILGDGSVKVYLDDKLVLDSSELEKSGISMITGLAISDLAETNESAVLSENITLAKTSETIENITKEETENITAPEILETENITNITQKVPENITIPEEMEANITIPEEINVSENITLPEEAVPELPEENITVPVPELPENITEIIFTDVCIETCSLELNKTSYDLRFEIENAVLYLDSISYTIQPIEILEEVPKLIENISKAEEIIQGQAEINKPVKWTKKITLNETSSNLTVKLPKGISDVRVSKIKDKIKEEISPDKLKIREAEQLKPISLITGYAVKITEEAEEETELVIEDDVREIEIEYYTKAPEVTEKEINAHKKQIVVSSDVHYTNITAYTTITESPKDSIKLYRTTDGIREPVQIINYTDTNNNSLIDKISWVVPSLSNETYEIEIIILNVQSYPMVGGNWTVRFNTTGRANLTIRAVDGTTWSNVNEGNDLRFLEVRCGSSVQEYEWMNNSVFIENYECNETSYEISKVLTAGKHSLEFRFGNNVEYAYNQAGWWNASWSYKQAINLTVSSGSTPQNYQIKLELNSSNAGTNWNWNNECVDSNSSRARFTNSSENTELDFWVESCSVSGQNMTVWVEVDQNITASGYIIYMYYGNTEAATKTDGTATFDFFDDFEGDLSKWTKHKELGTITLTNGYVECGGGITSGTYGHTVLGSNATYNEFVNGIIEGKVYFTTDSIGEISFRSNYAGNTGYKARMDARTGEGISFLNSPYNAWGFLTGCTASGTPVGTGSWMPFNITVNGGTSTIKVDGQTQACSATTSTSAGEISLQNHYGSYTRYDDIRVRKYTSSEPTYLIGDEEIKGFPKVILEFPPDNYVTTTDITLNATVTDDFNLVNCSLWYDTPTWHLNQTQTITGTSNITTFNLTGLENVAFIWNIQCFDNDSQAGWGSENRTVIIDVLPPSVTINSPSGTLADTTPTLNVTISDTIGVIDTLWYNIGNGTNVTICNNCSGEKIKFLHKAEGSYVVYIYANDSLGHLNNTESSSFTIDMNQNYYDTYDDNSSVAVYNDVSWQEGNVSFNGSSGNTFVAGISYEAINNDGDSGISSSKVYTHAIDFGTQTTGGVATINGVVFVDGNGGNFPAIGGGSETIGTGTSTIPTDHGGNNVANAYLNGGSPADMEDLVYDMTYNDATAMISLTGLTPGQEYQFRLYHRPWSIGYNRNQNIGFETDGIGSGVAGSEHTAVFNEDDASVADSNFATSTQVYALTYNYTLSAGVTNLTIYIDQTGGGTYHLYGLTNEELPASGSGVNSGNFTSHSINTTNNITSIDNVTWTEDNTDANNNITVEISVDNEQNWYTATNNSGISGFAQDNSLVYRVNFATNGTKTISLLDMNITWSEQAVENQVPVITYVSDIPAQSVSAGTVTYISFTFNATDEDGASNLNDTAAMASFNLTGETTRTNTSCSLLAESGNTRQYNCTIGIWYWDGAGNWTINASIRDINDAYAENSSTTFELQETTAMVMSPTALTWDSLSLTDTNKTSNNDPIVINNTANKNIVYVNVTAIDLQGAEITSDFIYANNFSVNVNDACEGTGLVNNTAIAVSGATLPKGNNSAGDGQESLYFCLNGMLQTISAQTYSTTLGQWTISVS